MLEDVIEGLIEILLTGGVHSPDTLERQRRARFVVSVVALIVSLGFLVLDRPSMFHGWSVVVLAVTTLAAGWALLFSVVDVVKELPSVTWLSIAAAVVAAGEISVVTLLVLGVMAARG